MHPVFGVHEDLLQSVLFMLWLWQELEQSSMALFCLLLPSLGIGTGGWQPWGVAWNIRLTEGSSRNGTGEPLIWSCRGRYHLGKQEQYADSYSWL